MEQTFALPAVAGALVLVAVAVAIAVVLRLLGGGSVLGLSLPGLAARPKCTVAVVGLQGSGKTTLASALCAPSTHMLLPTTRVGKRWIEVVPAAPAAKPPAPLRVCVLDTPGHDSLWPGAVQAVMGTADMVVVALNTAELFPYSVSLQLDTLGDEAASALVSAGAYCAVAKAGQLDEGRAERRAAARFLVSVLGHPRYAMRAVATCLAFTFDGGLGLSAAVLKRLMEFELQMHASASKPDAEHDQAVEVLGRSQLLDLREFYPDKQDQIASALGQWIAGRGRVPAKSHAD